MWRGLYHIARADFRERVRRYSFLVILVVTIYAAYGFVPPNDSTYSTVTVGGHRGVYNSAWIGTQVAMLTSVFLALFGFYLIKNAVERDYRTGVGQIIAATRATKLEYLLGKMASNMAVLGAMVIALVVVAAIMQIVRGENTRLDPLGLLVPFVFTLLPVIALIAAIAVFFECIPLLRGGFGNIVYFFTIMGMLSAQLLEAADVFGLSPFLSSMKLSARNAFPTDIGQNMEVNIGIRIENSGVPVHLQTFQWDGLALSGAMWLGRLFWVGIAIAIAGAASLIFDRFDTARATQSQSPKRKTGRVTLSDDLAAQTMPPSSTALLPVAHLSALSETARGGRLIQMVIAELKLMLKGRSWAWSLVGAVLIVLGAVLPKENALGFVLPIAWIWPTLLWSSLGCREMQAGTNQIIFSAARPIRRQLPAAWIAGTIVAMAIGAGLGIRLLLTGDIGGFAAWAVGAMFIPALALACGAWTNNSRLFEALYLFWWYAGPLNRVPTLDFMGASGRLHTAGITSGYLLLTILLLGLAMLARRRQIRV